MLNMWILLINLLKRLSKAENGLATIPTVITAVSFVTAAGVLATAVVTQGSDASQEASQVIQDTLQNIQGTYQLRGGVIGIASQPGSNGMLGQLCFTVSLAVGGGMVDFTPPAVSANNTGLADPSSTNTIVISYTDNLQHVDNLYWTLKKSGKDDGDNLLSDDELYQITIGGSPVPGQDGGNLVDALPVKPLSSDTTFEIEIKAPQGAILNLERRTPAYINNVVNFHY